MTSSAEQPPDARLGAHVYCASHCTVHSSGWCTVDVYNKLGLGTYNREVAELKANLLALDAYSGISGGGLNTKRADARIASTVENEYPFGWAHELSDDETERIYIHGYEFPEGAPVWCFFCGTEDSAGAADCECPGVFHVAVAPRESKEFAYQMRELLSLRDYLRAAGYIPPHDDWK